MRVAMIGLRGIPATYGGIERAVEELSIRLAASGHDVTVFCRSAYAPGREQFHRGVRLRRLPSWNTKHLEAITHTLLAVCLIGRKRYDIVHFHGTGPALLAWIPRIRGLRVVATVQGLDFERAKWGPLASAVLRLGAWATATIPHATVVVSRDLQREYEGRFKRRTWYVPNGVVVPEGESHAPSIPGRPFVLFLARLVPEKRVTDLIDTFRSLDVDAELRIVGPASHSGGYEDACRARAAGDERILFTGPVYGEAKEALLASATVFCQPSELEGLPLAVLEAMAAACCVVASDIPPHRELLAGEPPAGRLFPVRDVHALALALQDCLSDAAQRQRLGGSARGRVRRLYGWDGIALTMEKVYESLNPKRREEHAA